MHKLPERNAFTDNLFLARSCKILARNFWLFIFLQEMSVKKIRRFFARLFQETCKTFLDLQDNSVLVRFLQVLSDASDSCRDLCKISLKDHLGLIYNFSFTETFWDNFKKTIFSLKKNLTHSLFLFSMSNVKTLSNFKTRCSLHLPEPPIENFFYRATSRKFCM